MSTAYKLAELSIPSDVHEVRELEVSKYVRDIHDMQPQDTVELDDGRKFLVSEFELSADSPPKAFVSMQQIRIR